MIPPPSESAILLLHAKERDMDASIQVFWQPH